MPLRRLPAGFPATAATAAAPTARFPATATAATTGTSTPASAATEASATAARGAIGFRTGFVHIERPSVQGVTVEGGNGLIRLAFVFHLDECEAAGTSGLAIRHDPGAVHLAVALEEAADALLGGVEIQVAYEYVLHSSLLSI